MGHTPHKHMYCNMQCGEKGTCHVQLPVKVPQMTQCIEYAGGNFRTPGGRNGPAWFRKHAPGFHARLGKHMTRASHNMG